MDSNRTLRFNRSMKDAGWRQMSQPDTPSVWSFLGMLGAAVLGAMVMGAWFWLVLGA